MSVENLSFADKLFYMLIAMGGLGLIQMYLKKNHSKRRINFGFFAAILVAFFAYMLCEKGESLATVIIMSFAWYHALVAMANFWSLVFPPSDDDSI